MATGERFQVFESCVFGAFLTASGLNVRRLERGARSVLNQGVRILLPANGLNVRHPERGPRLGGRRGGCGFGPRAARSKTPAHIHCWLEGSQLEHVLPDAMIRG